MWVFLVQLWNLESESLPYRLLSDLLPALQATQWPPASLLSYHSFTCPFIFTAVIHSSSSVTCVPWTQGCCKRNLTPLSHGYLSESDGVNFKHCSQCYMQLSLCVNEAGLSPGKSYWQVGVLIFSHAAALFLQWDLSTAASYSFLLACILFSILLLMLPIHRDTCSFDINTKTVF